MSDIQRQYWDTMASTIEDRIALNHWVDEKGAPLDNKLFSEISDYLSDFIPNNNSAKVLEIGCGNGLILENLQRLNPTWQLYGSDVSAEMIKRIQIPLNKVICTDASDLSAFSTESFDLIFMHSVIQYFESEEYFGKVVFECAQKLNENGYLIILDAPLIWYEDYMRSRSFKRDLLDFSKKHLLFFYRLYTKLKRRQAATEIINGVSLKVPTFKGFYFNPDQLTDFESSFTNIRVELQPFKFKPITYKKFRFNIILKK